MYNIKKYFIVLYVFLFLSSTAVSAQNAYTGKVVDDKGNAVPTAVVSVMESQTKVIYNTISNLEGVFTLRNIEPGQYTLAFSCASRGCSK